MFSFSEQNDRLQCEFSSEVHLIDRCIALLRSFVSQVDVGSATTGLEQAVREMLLNAVEHGNKGDPSKQVNCIAEHIGNDRFKVTVTDQGDGFDFGAIDFLKAAQPEAIRNRGFAMISMIADTLDFGEKGATITISATLPHETAIEVVVNNGDYTIIPKGDLVASCSEILRKTLVSCMEKGPRILRFDLKRVENIDSICLSVFALLTRTVAAGTVPTKLEIINARKEFEELFWLTRLSDAYTFPAGAGNG